MCHEKTRTFISLLKQKNHQYKRSIKDQGSISERIQRHPKLKRNHLFYEREFER